MALTFPGLATANSTLQFSTTGDKSLPYGTSVAVVYQTSNASGPASVLFLGTGASADDIDIINVYDVPTANVIGYWNSTGATDCKSTLGLSLNKWYLIAVSKDTGNVAPRAHIFDFTTGTWTQQACSGSDADSAVTSETVYAIGGFASGNFNFPGHIAATGSWHSRVLSDGEIQRLAAGNWNRYSPDTLIEAKSGRTVLGVGPMDHGRQRMIMNTFGAAVTRAAIGDPPGFRFSLAGRRR